MKRAQSTALRILATLAVPALLGAPSGCRQKPVDDGTAPKPLTLPQLDLREGSPEELLLTWVDGKGDGHTVTKLEDVPMEGRDQVRVVVVGKDDGTRELFYVANLTVKSPDGSYPVSTMPRSEWDAMIAKRRTPVVPKIVPPESPAPPSLANPSSEGEPSPMGATVIVYTASWCGACKSTVAYLKQRRVPFIEKDIEEDESAAQEMDRKLARAGIRGGSIPVLDVRGRIVVGFDRRAIDNALRGGTGGTAL